MAFRLRKDARGWFKDLEPAFALDFDMYYLCLMAGLSTGRKEDVLTAETTELVDEFPGEYRSNGRLIVALFLARELKAMGIQFSERAALHGQIRTLINPLSASHLSDAGMREVNRYAYGGFEVLTDWFHDRPRNIETFLPLFKRYIDTALAKTS